MLLVNFIKQSIKEETISQYKLNASSLIKELVQFAHEFKDEDDEPSLIEKIKNASGEFMMREDQIENLQAETNRVIKMFYLQMKVKGLLKPLKEDYFV